MQGVVADKSALPLAVTVTARCSLDRSPMKLMQHGVSGVD